MVQVGSEHSVVGERQCRVGTQDDPFAVDHRKPVRRPLDQFFDRNRLVSGQAELLRPHRRQLQQENRTRLGFDQ